MKSYLVLEIMFVSTFTWNFIAKGFRQGPTICNYFYYKNKHC